MASWGLLLLVPMLPALLQGWQAMRGPSAPDTPWLDAAFPLLAAVAGATWLMALTGRARGWLLFMVPAALLAPLELFYVAVFGLPSGAHVYGVLADTHRDEALTWLGPWLFPAFGAMALLLVAVAAAAWQWWRADLRWRHRSRQWVLLAGALLLVGGWLDHRSQQASGTGLVTGNPYLQHPLAAAPAGLAERLEATFPWGLPLRWQRFTEDRQALAAHQARVAAFRFPLRMAAWPAAASHAAIVSASAAKATPASTRAGAAEPATATAPAPASAPAPTPAQAPREIHLLVIGETGRADRWGLYGAARDTTPRLAARPGLLVFHNAVSAASATRESVPLMLTRRPPQAMLLPTGEPSVVTAFRQAGFRTAWLSNQGIAGAHETPVSVLAREADTHLFLNPADYRGRGAHDGALLAPLARELGQDRPQEVAQQPTQQPTQHPAQPPARRTAPVATRQFIVLHTLGSHLSYANRYPAAFERFRPAVAPDEAPDIWRAAAKDRLLNAYDNSVLYTDWLLDQAITALESTGAVATLTYAADHGETLFDGRCGRAGHGFAAQVNYRVPMLLWLSPAWRARHPEATARLTERQTQAVSTLALFPTLTGLAGFSVDAPHAHADLAAPHWRPGQRLATHFGDVDGPAFRAAACDLPPAAPAALPAGSR